MRIFQLSISLLFISVINFSQSLVTAAKIPEAEHFTIESGMSQTRVNITFTDAFGFLWIGTSDGLNRYDGYKFHVFKHIPYDSSSLSQNFIRCIAQDADANLWIGTNSGLNFYNRQTGKFSQFTHNPAVASSISDNRILALFVDSKGFVWIKTEQYFDKLDPSRGNVTHYKHYVNRFNNNPVSQNCLVVEDVNGIFWFGSNDGLFSFNPQTETFSHYFHSYEISESISNNEILSIFEDKNGELWVGTKNGINKFDRQYKNFKRYLFSPHGESSISVNSIIEDDKGLFWLGTGRGVVLFDKRKVNPEHLSGLIINKSLYSLGSITGLLLDKSGIIWMSGFQGLFKIDTKPKKFNVYNSSFNSYPALSGDMISCVYKETDELIWVGAWDYGLNILNRKTGKVEKYSFNNPDPAKRISSDQVKCIFKDHTGVIWLGSFNGLDIFDPKTRTFSRFDEKYPSVFSQILNNRRILCMTENKLGDLWIGTDKGVLRFQRKFKLFTSYNKIYRENITAEMGYVYALAADNENRIWIGTENGLNCNDLEKDFFYRYEETGREKDLSSRIIYSLLFDSRNTLWVGTASGLNKYNPKTENFDLFTEAEGLSNNQINSLLEDGNHCIWISTNKGLSKFDLNTNEFTNFSITDGLQSFEFIQAASSKADDGEMFFGGISVFNSFYPENLPVNPYRPEIVVVSIDVFDNNGIAHPYSGEGFKSVVVGDKQSFTVRFAALDFTLPESNAFEYSMQLKGKDERWIPIGNQNSVTFLNLPRGEYALRIRGSNNDQVWNTQGTEVEFVSTSPFWRTNFALALFSLITVFFIYVVIQYRTQSLRKSNRILRDRDIAAKEISRQKDMLSLRNKNIEDSLNYAQRIQKAMLTTPKQFRSILPNSFVLHKPKDIVSGDFYWISEQEGKVFVAAADCTGHGVPGAFMSLISFELFRKIIKTQKIYSPALILNAINNNFEEIFGNVEDIAIKDGMDLSFCVLDKSMGKLEYSGAFNPLYIVREKKLIELKGDRFSIGADIANEIPEKIFTNHIFHLRPNDMIYMFSDGYADQFGGPEGKKYKYRRFRHLLLNIHQLPLEKQMALIDENIEEWRGSIEQIDDILVIGIRIP